ncbi:MAG: hypothetical protein KBS81_03975 [Spirochaetales bacterium]|nr:hypothetical protein [Candidatus Physcosoma equi]
MDGFKSFIKKNPAEVLFLSACPALAATATLKGSLAMGITVAIILILSSLVMSLVKKFTGEETKVALAVIISAGFASCAQMILAAYLPKVYALLGVYVAIAAVNAMIIRTEAETASVESMGATLACAFDTSIRFILVVAFTGLVRELLGAGTLFGSKIGFFSAHTIPVLQKASGAFIVFAIALALVNLTRKEAK